jgi:hypothetical protein
METLQNRLKEIVGILPSDMDVAGRLLILSKARIDRSLEWI